MSGQHKNKKNKKVREIAIQDSAIQLSMLKMNRWVLTIIIGLVLLVFYMGTLLMPANDMIDRASEMSKPVELYDVQMNPVVSAEVDALKSQLVALVSGSIESKLKILEEGLRTGTISETGLNTIHALQEDLVVLRTYSETGAGRLIAQKYLEQTEGKTGTKDLAAEVSQLRSMVHFLIASSGLMIAAVAGVWVRKRYALVNDDSQQKRIL